MQPMTFEPPYGIAESLGPGLRRIVAPNPSPMTFRGTNTYLLGTRDLAVVDPGPDLPDHLNAILAAVGPDQRISHVLVTHAHRDHSPLARPLSQATGAPVLAFGGPLAGRSPLMHRLALSGLTEGGEGVDDDFKPDRLLADGEVVQGDDWQITALWTPGHMSNHMCFVWQDMLMTGDLVMGWASSLVSPPDGDVAAFLSSCRRLLNRADRIFLPAHGAPVTTPRERLDWLIAHRTTREQQILDTLTGQSLSVADLVREIYSDLPAGLHGAAARNVLAHLIDLTDRGHVLATPELSSRANFTTTRTP